VVYMASSIGCRGGLLSHMGEVERGRGGLIRTPAGRDGGSWRTTCSWRVSLAEPSIREPYSGMKHWAHESRKLQIAILPEVAWAYAVRIYCLLRLLGQLAVRNRRRRYALASNKLWRVFGATRDLLEKAPDKLTGVNGTGDIGLDCAHRWR